MRGREKVKEKMIVARWILCILLSTWIPLILPSFSTRTHGTTHMSQPLLLSFCQQSDIHALTRNGIGGNSAIKKLSLSLFSHHLCVCVWIHCHHPPCNLSNVNHGEKQIVYVYNIQEMMWLVKRNCTKSKSVIKGK